MSLTGSFAIQIIVVRFEGGDTHPSPSCTSSLFRAYQIKRKSKITRDGSARVSPRLILKNPMAEASPALRASLCLFVAIQV
jgi:hypothetical protein